MVSNEQLIKEYQSGNKGALEQLIKQNEKFVYSIANRYYTENTNSVDKDDLIQEGYLGLMRAAELYDTEMEYKAKFITYAAHWINSKIHRFITTKNTNNEISLENPIKVNELDIPLADILEGENGDQYIEDIEKKELQMEVRSLMKDHLTLEEREIIKCRYGFYGQIFTLNATADILGFTNTAKQEKVRTIESRSLRKLRHTTFARRYRTEVLLQNAVGEKNTELAALKRMELEEYKDNLFYKELLKSFTEKNARKNKCLVS